MASDLTSPGTRIALAVISALADMPEGCAGSELASLVGDPSATTFARVLRMLVEEGWVRRSQERYLPGPFLLQSACRLVSQVSGEDHLAPVVEDLARTSGQSAAFAKWHQVGIRFHAKHEMPESFHYIELGALNRHNLYNAFNIVCLAYLPDAQARRIAAAPQPLSSLFASVDQFRSTAQDIRRDRVYQCRDTVTRVVAPVFYRDTDIFAGAIGVSALAHPVSDHQAARYRELVSHAATNAANHLPRRIHE